MPRNFFDEPKVRLQFKPFGKWDESIKLIQKLKPSIKKASQEAQIRVCREIIKNVKAHLRNQDLPWRKLGENYVKSKKQHGWDTRILMATHAYYNSIEIITKGSQHLVFVGVRRGIYTTRRDGKRNPLEVAQIAVIHEFSANAKRRRPLWNPTIRQMGGGKGLKILYEQHFYKQLKRRGIPITKLAPYMKWR